MARYALVLLLAAPLLAQTPRYQEELTVTEVTLDLVVTDRKGDRITGLTAADFEVLEDGLPVTITYFREIDASRKGRPRGSAISKGETAPAVSEARSAFIFLDNADIARTARTPLFDSLETSVVEMMASGVEVIFFLWTGRLEVIQPHDAATAVEILQELKTNGEMWRAAAGRDNFRVGTLDFDDPDLGMARQVGRSRSFRLFEAFDAAAKIVAKTPGRRILVLASRGFAVPVTDAQIAAAERAAIETVPDHPLAVEGPGFAPEVMIPTHGGNSRENSIEDWVAAIANRHGIAIYGMFSGGLEAGTRTGITERRVPMGQRPSLNPSGPFVSPRALGQLSLRDGIDNRHSRTNGRHRDRRDIEFRAVSRPGGDRSQPLLHDRVPLFGRAALPEARGSLHKPRVEGAASGSRAAGSGSRHTLTTSAHRSISSMVPIVTRFHPPAKRRLGIRMFRSRRRVASPRSPSWNQTKFSEEGTCRIPRSWNVR